MPERGLPPELDAVARSAPFVFAGVVRRRSERQPLAPADAPTAVVRIDEVFFAPPTLGDLTGRDIAVRLAEPAPPARRRIIFFAGSLSYGAELAVTELARAPAGRAAADIRDRILDVRLQQYDERLRERLRRAEIVLYGRAGSVKPLESDKESADEPLT